MPRSYQVTPGILRRRRATQPKKVRPTADSMEKSQPAADREPSRPRRTPPPDELRLSLTWKGAARLLVQPSTALRRKQQRARRVPAPPIRDRRRTLTSPSVESQPFGRAHDLQK